MLFGPERNQSRDTVMAAPGMPTPNQYRILIVEDDAIQRFAMAMPLRQAGYQVLEAGNGLEALSLANEGPNFDVDLLISDLSVPFILGEELIRQLKLTRPEMRVLVVSGNRFADFRPALASYVNDFVSKPVDPASLVTRVQSLLAPTQP